MMEGTRKTLKEKFHPHERTNFSDWSDPKDTFLRSFAEPFKKENNEEEEPLSKSLDQASIISRTSVEIEILRKKIKDGYPLLSKKEICQHRLPFYESLIINLKEDGFVATSEFIKDLIKLDEELHGQQELESSVKSRPLLKESVSILKIMCEKLVSAEVAKMEGNSREETKALLSIAIHFSKPDNASWFWLAEELFEQSIIVGEEQGSSEVDNETKAIAKHLFASFLLDFLNDAERSRQLVEESMALSIGKFWNASEITGQQRDILYLESCLLLHRVFLQLANKLKSYDLEGAIQLCRSSLLWAKQINCKYAESKALLSLAMFYLAAKQYSPILSNLENYLKLCIELEDYEGLCEGHILMAQYHEQLKDDDLLLDDLKNLLKVAKEKNILKMKALAYWKLALYYLVHSDEKEMLQAAVKAYKYFGQLNNVKDLDNARCLVGIAQAHKIMPHYLSILLDANNINTTEFEHLMLWKNLRIPFFSNVKLFQPVADDNFELKERIEQIRTEEFEMANQAKQAELSSKVSSHTTMRHMLSIQSTPKMSMGVQNFQKQFKTAMFASESSLKLN